MKQPLVSVVIPTYQRVATLRRAIDAALAQTYEPIEVVVSDNGSTDGTRELLEEYAGDPRVVVVLQDSNRGPVPNWRAAVEAASGRHIKINWSDDWMEGHVVARLVAAMRQAPDIGFVTMNQTLHLPDGARAWRRKGGVVSLGDLVGSRLLALGLPVSPGAGLIHREDATWALGRGLDLLGADCGRRAIGPDLLMLYGGLRRGLRGIHLDEEGVHFQGGADSITMTEERQVLSQCYYEALWVLVKESEDDASHAAMQVLSNLRRGYARIRGHVGPTNPGGPTPELSAAAWVRGTRIAVEQIGRRLTRRR